MHTPETPQPGTKLSATAITFAAIGSLIPALILGFAIFWFTGGTDPTPAEDLLFLAIIIGLVVGPSLIAAIIVGVVMANRRKR